MIDVVLGAVTLPQLALLGVAAGFAVLTVEEVPGLGWVPEMVGYGALVTGGAFLVGWHGKPFLRDALGSLVQTALRSLKAAIPLVMGGLHA